MTRINHMAVNFVESIPVQLEAGVLYVSIDYRTMSHLCACGCGRRVATPIRPHPHGWTVAYDGANATVSPSVGLLKLPCRSHYFIDRGRVRWLPAEDELDTADDSHTPEQAPKPWQRGLPKWSQRWGGWRVRA